MRVATTVAVLVCLSLVAASPSATSAGSAAPAPNATAAPGAHLAGAATVGATELEATVAAAAFEARLASAETDAARADAVVAYLAAANRSLDSLDREAERVRAARANESMDAGEYAARLATVAAGARVAHGVANRSEAAAATIPPALRRERGIPSLVRTVRRRADALLSDPAMDDVAGDGPGADGTASDALDPNRAAPLTLEDVVGSYEAAAGDAPQEMLEVVGSERVVVVLRRADGRTAAFTLRTRDGRVVGATRGRSGNATVRVYTTHAVLREVRRADRPWQVLRGALADGRLDYDGVGPANTLKYGVASLVQEATDVLDGVL